MTHVTYDKRILIDRYFVEWLKQLKQTDSKKWNDFTKQLLYIKASSIDHRKCHNVMLKEDFELLKKDGSLISENLHAMVKPMEKPNFIKDNDEITVTIKTAIFLTNDKPYSTVIFTSPEKVANYHSNPHYKQVSSVIINGGEEAVSTVKYFFGRYESSK